jgi:hypothetical protein
MIYDPTRAWDVAETEITFLNNNAHYLYLMVEINELATTSEVIASEDHIDPLRDEGYIIYKLGIVQGVVDGVREASMLWGNVKTTPDKYYRQTQTAHGFAVGNAVGIVGSTWVKAKADSPANAVTLGLVSQVVDANNFRYVKGGVLAGTYTAGANYFLSTSVAGDLMILSEPEVWTDGQVRQYIGTGTKNGDGLDVEIDIGDVVGIGLAPDKYVSAISFDATYRILSLTRTGGLPALSVILPYPASDIAFEARDVTKGIAQTYVLDMKASWPYRILSIVTESDGTLTGVSVKINSTAVSGLGSLSIGTKAEINATSANSVATGDVVTINTAATYSDNPTLIRVKLKIQRV